MIQQMWANCMPHVKLATFKKSRDKWEAETSRTGKIYSMQFLGLFRERASSGRVTGKAGGVLLYSYRRKNL